MGFGYNMGFVAIVRGIAEWSKNNDSPRLTVPATVVQRRRRVTHHHHHGANGAHHVHPVTHYHITFEVDSGDRMEFSVSGSEYGLLAEGDHGSLTFQGTRYLGFDRMTDHT